MVKHNGKLQYFVELANIGEIKQVDLIMKNLTIESDLATTRFIDFALSLVNKKKGIERIKHYLFNGSLIQRNYACLFFNRLGEWKFVKEAYEKGLIDEIQAFSR